MKKHYRSDKNCLNCGAVVPDKFCTNCGQENIELKEDFVHVALHSIGHYFHFESKFFKSIVPLFTKPGLLTQEYFAGKRASHLNPISMYIFISILFFFLFTVNSNVNRKGIIEDKAPEQKTVVQVDVAAQTNTEEEKTPALNTTSPKAGGHTYTVLDKTKMGSTDNQEGVVVYTGPSAQEAGIEKAGIAPESPLEINVGVSPTLQEKLSKVMNDDLSSELFINKLWSHLPKMMFILLPLFAFILMLVNRNSKKYYVEHLIYSIHVHSFIFLFFSALILIGWLLPDSLTDWISLFGLLVVVWYIYRSMRNIYRSTRWRTIYKFFVLSLVYSILLAASGTIVFVATLYTM
ncbi:DUF3667 domain-containing protein [Pontibacter ramchanderi]|uniref:Uncharacterized protein DUF3667 n=1 Tax=Pontibacter ramchanderi TaxID=1179743 RepID=A0A2N3UA00_9BACT|nr:DUF3667 domain-containing protein [Pontibacter ramchanderi]PKV63544.1 uncharacterized protein DUF3667 [Pontibacter ramchanderi]